MNITPALSHALRSVMRIVPTVVLIIQFTWKTFKPIVIMLGVLVGSLVSVLLIVALGPFNSEGQVMLGMIAGAFVGYVVGVLLIWGFHLFRLRIFLAREFYQFKEKAHAAHHQG